MNKKIVLFCIICCCAVSSCQKDDPPSKPELTSALLIDGTFVLIAGLPTTLPVEVFNSGDGNRTTLDAGPSVAKVIVSFDSNGDGDYETMVSEIDLQTSIIPPDIGDLCEFTVVFNEPGEYQIITIADSNQEVEERDETNNSSTEKLN